MSDTSSPHSSYSMLPLILPTDQLIITKSKKNNFEDVVVFYKNRSLIAHRIIFQSKDHLITKGDNNTKADKKIAQNQILGVVHQITRNKQIVSLNHIYLTQSLKYLQIINLLINKLDRNNINYVFLKGLPIHLHYSKSPPQHLFLDLDILIPKEHLKKIKIILIALGFNPSSKSPYQDPKKEPTQYNFFKIDKPINLFIDLHTLPGFGFTKSIHVNSLLPNEEALIKYLMNNTQKININNQKISLLKPETQVILLLLHLFHHNFKQIQKLSIIKQINKQKLNWNKVFSDISKLNLSPYIKPAILLFNHYYPNIIPQKHLKNIKDLKSFLIKFTHQNSVFNQQNQNISGIHRFFLILFLSNSSFSTKIKTIFNQNTLINSYKVIKSFFSNSNKNSSTSSRT